MTMRTSSWATIGALVLGLTVAAPAAAQDDYEERAFPDIEVEAEEAVARFRFGITGLGGAQWGGGPELGMGGAALRLGIQLGDWGAIYYQPTGLVGTAFEREGEGDSVLGQLWNTGVIELTIFDLVQIGGGPSADFIWGCEPTIQDEAACAAESVAFGLDGRLALVLGGMNQPGQRDGLVIEARFHASWYDTEDASVAVVGGVGYELY